MIGGVLTPLQALSGFGSPALITLMGLFAVSAALFRSGALDRLRELIASERIRSSRRMIGLMAFVMAPISGVVPNTPIVASLLPVLETWCHKRGIAPSRVLLPLSFATLLGGTLTLLGSSVNLLASDVSQQLGYGALDLFSFTAIGVPVWLAGATYMLLAPRALLPGSQVHDDHLSTSQALSGYCTEVTIPPDSEAWWAAPCCTAACSVASMLMCWNCSGEENASFLLLRIAALRLEIACCCGSPARICCDCSRITPFSSQPSGQNSMGASVSLQCRRRAVRNRGSVAACRFNAGRSQPAGTAVPSAAQRHGAGPAPRPGDGSGTPWPGDSARRRRLAAAGSTGCHPRPSGQQ